MQPWEWACGHLHRAFWGRGYAEWQVPSAHRLLSLWAKAWPEEDKRDPGLSVESSA